MDMILDKYNNLLFVENHHICKMYGKVFDHNTQYIDHEYVNILEKSSKCNELNNMIHEFNQSAVHKTNHRDTKEHQRILQI